jgi:hypothetical protein
MPVFRKHNSFPLDATVDEMIYDIDRLMELFDKIEWLQFVGGEIFLHNGLEDVWTYAKKYHESGKFDKLVIETNATIAPTDAQASALKLYGMNCKIMISDYGDISRGKTKWLSMIEEIGAEYVLKKYNGDLSEQHFGGWTDNTACRDLLEPDIFVTEQASNCPQVRIENMHIFKGKLHRCSNSLFLSQLGVCTPNIDDFVDFKTNNTIEQNREIISNFYNYPRKSCHYCTYKSISTSERFTAAEQEKK